MPRRADPDLVRRADVAYFPDAIMTVVIGFAVRVGDTTRGLAENRSAKVSTQDVLLDLAREDLAPRHVMIDIFDTCGAKVCADLLPMKQASEDGGVCEARQRTSPGDTFIGVVHTGYYRAPVEDPLCTAGMLTKYLKRPFRDYAIDRFETRVRNARPSHQNRDLEMT